MRGHSLQLVVLAQKYTDVSSVFQNLRLHGLIRLKSCQNFTVCIHKKKTKKNMSWPYTAVILIKVAVETVNISFELDSQHPLHTDVSSLFKNSFKWLEQWRATSFGTGASFSWTRLERLTCTWFSHNTKFCLSASWIPQMVVHVGKDEILVRHPQTLGHRFTKTLSAV